MIYACRQWFLVLCVIGLSLKLEKCWVRIKSSRRTRCVIWLHKHKSIRSQRCCWATPNLLLYIQTSLCVFLFQRHVMLKDRPSAYLSPFLMLCVSQREMASDLQNSDSPGEQIMALQPNELKSSHLQQEYSRQRSQTPTTTQYTILRLINN